MTRTQMIDRLRTARFLWDHENSWIRDAVALGIDDATSLPDWEGRIRVCNARWHLLMEVLEHAPLDCALYAALKTR